MMLLLSENAPETLNRLRTMNQLADFLVSRHNRQQKETTAYPLIFTHNMRLVAYAATML